MGRDYQKDKSIVYLQVICCKNRKRLFHIVNATKFANGNNEALLGVISDMGYLGGGGGELTRRRIFKKPNWYYSDTNHRN